MIRPISTNSNNSQVKPVFADRTFYLDLRNVPSLRPKLTFGITALKGTIEEFLSKDVKYLITDKPEKDWPAKQPDTSQENGEGSSQPTASSSNSASTVPLTSTPNPLVTHNSISQVVASNATLATAGTNITTASSITTTTAAAAASVGTGTSNTTATTITSKSTTTDVLEIAMRRNVKIISASRMLEFLIGRVSIPGVSAPGSGENLMRGISLGETDSFASSREKNKSLRAVKFKAPFIKIEAYEQTSRPFWKLFQTWPDILFDSNNSGCPFKNTSQSAAALTAARVTAVAKKLNLPSSAKANGNQQASPLGSLSRPIPLTASATITASNIVVNGNLSNACKRRKMFCEICSVEYSSIREHLPTHSHTSYTENQENFKELVHVIESLPSFDDLLKH